MRMTVYCYKHQQPVSHKHAQLLMNVHSRVSVQLTGCCVFSQQKSSFIDTDRLTPSFSSIFPLPELASYSCYKTVMRSDSSCRLFRLDVIHLAHCRANLQQQTINSKQIATSRLKGSLSVLITVRSQFVDSVKRLIWSAYTCHSLTFYLRLLLLPSLLLCLILFYITLLII